VEVFMKNLIVLTSSILFLVLTFFAETAQGISQDKTLETSNVVVKNGVLVWQNGEKIGQEISLFGVNYSAPFAYSYRAIKRLGEDHKFAIDMDVEHIARLGLDAYRIHLWDRELTDLKGNLLKNEQLALFDYLLFKLKQKNIKVIITPIAWWGSGYPEPDPKETGFAQNFTKAQMNEIPEAITAQVNYLTQLMTYENQYTGEKYGQDSNIIAFEIFNEPKHHQSPKHSTAYVEKLISVMRKVGVTKPLFYNVSEQGDNQAYAKALCESSIDGISYQWYPTGLVKNSTILANMLPTVASYNNPFAEINACKNKAKMVYEFDAADVTSSTMYPAMARSFRSAGFQWATQFSYDPAVIAHTNSEYSTHYLNLLYTPSKAISFMIAAKVFRNLPRNYHGQPYPENNHFNDVVLDHHKNLSVLNNDQFFYYSNTNEISPKNVKKLKHIAGVGNSEIVNYQGRGAYFLDKLADGIWQLEVYPDLQPIQDQHQHSSLKREVGRLYLNNQEFQLQLPTLGKHFNIEAINYGNKFRKLVNNGHFSVRPGKYILSKNKIDDLASVIKKYDVNQAYYLPKIADDGLTLHHQEQRVMSVNDSIIFTVEIGANEKPERVELMLRHRSDRHFTTLTMEPSGGGRYSANLPDKQKWSITGPLEYAFVVTQKSQQITFPGGVQGSPLDWDFVSTVPLWQMDIQPPGTPITIFDAKADKNNLLYPKSGRVKQEYFSGQDGLGTALRLSLDYDKSDVQNFLLRTTLAADNQLTHRDLLGYNMLAIKIRSLKRTEHLSIGLLDEHSLAHSIDLIIKQNWQTLLIPLSSLQASDTMMVNGYPSFISPLLKQTSTRQGELNWGENKDLSKLQGLQLMLNMDTYTKDQLDGEHIIEIEHIRLIKG
jgi:hypothetical protein